MAKLLQSAGTAVTYLTNDPSAELPASSSDPVEARKAAFRDQVDTFLELFSKIKDALSSEANALQHAALIPAKPPAPAALMGEEEQGITNGGLGNFDVGWLNSRGDAVLRGKEKEVWAEVRRTLEQMHPSANGQQNGTSTTVEKSDD